MWISCHWFVFDWTISISVYRQILYRRLWMCASANTALNVERALSVDRLQNDQIASHDKVHFRITQFYRYFREIIFAFLVYCAGRWSFSVSKWTENSSSDSSPMLNCLKYKRCSAWSTQGCNGISEVGRSSARVHRTP